MQKNLNLLQDLQNSSNNFPKKLKYLSIITIHNTIFCFVFETGLLSPYTVESGYNDIGLRDTSLITFDLLWYQLIFSLLTITL